MDKKDILILIEKVYKSPVRFRSLKSGGAELWSNKEERLLEIGFYDGLCAIKEAIENPEPSKED